MPIYAYRCEECGFAKDVLQKISDDPLSVCPTCGKASFKKQVTAAGFQLKGSGWYVTDFRGGSGGTGTTPAAEPAGEAAASAPAAESGSTAGPTVTASPSSAASTPSDGNKAA
ncbi:FmdB family zinc ribbon protein [Undibacterium sp. TJN19]|uniref:FmdB family zinc ribbon protein n=1 Tax=Undibacterium sp. TJN19 TaxID=3413055 RepID=UPI003BF1DF72